MTALYASLPDLLVSGGDERLDLDGAGLNRYGHGPVPRPTDLAFGSSTASTISPDAFAWLDGHRHGLADAIARRGVARVHREEAASVRGGILACLGAGDAPPDVILAASGTDIHLVATALVVPPDRSMLVISLSEHETGSGVAAAVSGRHFAGRTANGEDVRVNATALGGTIEHRILPIRTPDGVVRDAGSVAEELEAEFEAAVDRGQHGLLVVTDVSKTGLLAPGPDTVLALKRRFGEALDILVDACQLRLGAATIRAYLDLGYLVAITGSKFLGGPVFSGALLCPAPRAARYRTRPLPAGLAAYLCRDFWPEDWPGRDALPCRPNFGLLQRWRAALFEWDRLQRVPADRLGLGARTFALSIGRQLCASEALLPVAVGAIDRAGGGGHDSVPTIFPFKLRAGGAGGGRLLSVAECRRLWSVLATPTHARPGVRLGQPVAIGTQGGVSIGALRLCLGAAQLARASSGAGPMADVIEEARLALRHVATELARNTGGVAHIAA